MDWLEWVGPGAFGIVGLLLGQWIGERRSRAREDRQRKDEQDRRAHESEQDRARRAHEVERDRAAWARERRYEAHVKFMTTFDELFDRVSAAELRWEYDGRSGPPPEPDEHFMVPLHNALTAVRLVSSDATAQAAKAALRALAERANQGADGGHFAEAMLSYDDYLGAIRNEFGLEPIQLMGDPTPLPRSVASGP